MSRRLLVIEDEERWQENLLAIIPADLDRHLAKTTAEATQLLRRYHYDIVLLDLNMDLTDTGKRDNKAIQSYLAARPEGTVYFVVSEYMTLDDALDAAFVNNAAWAVQKRKIDVEVMREKIRTTLDELTPQQATFTADARMMLVGDLLLENQIINATGVGGAHGFGQMLDTVLRKLTPLAQHSYRPKLVIRNRTVVGLAWSRQRGKAVSLSFANVLVPPEEQARELVDWLGYEERLPELDEKVFFNKVRFQCFAEPNLTDEHFDLPRIASV